MLKVKTPMYIHFVTEHRIYLILFEFRGKNVLKFSIM